MSFGLLRLEEEVARNPYHLKSWLNYLLAKKGSSAPSKFLVYERALIALPRSYKLWFAYLNERWTSVKQRPTQKRYEVLFDAFERCLVHLSKMPKLWLLYCEVFTSSPYGNHCRRVFDRALQALPITQHKEIWSLYVDWVKEFGVPETAVRVFRRFLMYDPSQRDDFVAYLESIDQHGEAAYQLSLCLNDENYVSPSGASKHQLWLKLCDICAKYPEQVSSQLRVDAIIRSGIAKFSDEVGRLWCRLADYYLRQGLLEKCRDIYEEALNAVTTVKDFTAVFDAYVKVEESILTASMEELAEGEEEDENGELAKEIEMRLARVEYLMEKRPLMLNSVVLRQNPNNVYEWHKRVKLFKGDAKRTLATFVEAVKTVDPHNANGRLSGLWLAFARFYEKSGDVESARTVFSKAVQVDFHSVEELANVWCGWGEMEVRKEEYQRALSVLQQALAEPPASVRRRKEAAMSAGKSASGFADHDANLKASDRLYKNVKVWSFYLDLEESLGTVQTVKAAYDRAFTLKVVTPQMALNFADYLEQNDYFEDSFRVFEQAVGLFTFPQVKAIWRKYAEKFLKRYGGTKVERMRDLYEQAILAMPPEDCAEFYIKYAKSEESHGLYRHAAAIYDRATRAVPPQRRLDMYRLYVKKVESFFGITKTRPIYDRAVQELDDNQSRELCLEYAQMERKLGEIDRSRAILQHGSQFADPRKCPHYWNQWKDFEESHGNEVTFREMLRVQRSVEAANSQVNYLAAELAGGQEFVPASSSVPTNSIEALSRAAENEAFVRATGMKRDLEESSSSLANPSGKKIARSSEELNIDEEDQFIQEKPVPQAVFGSL